jgi:acetyl-CoA acetyltransferase
MLGDCNIVLVGGSDNMSQAPYAECKELPIGQVCMLSLSNHGNFKKTNQELTNL